MNMPDVNGDDRGARGIRAAAVERQIVGAAHRLFLESGYVGTTIEAIASEAGVAIQTIYNVVGPKSAILSRVLDLAASGPEAPRPVVEFMAVRAGATASSTAVVEMLADWFVEVHVRTGPIFRLIHTAAAVDPEIAQLESQRALRRLENYGLAAAEIAKRDSLRSGMSVEEAAAAIWSIGHPDTFRFFVEDAGWSVDAYRAWVVVTLRGVLLAV